MIKRKGFVSGSLAEVSADLRHAGHLVHMERTGVVAVSAPRAGIGLHSQSRIVLRRQGVPGPGQVAGHGRQWLQYTHLPSASGGVNDPMTE